jgi:hypothetical protein
MARRFDHKFITRGQHTEHHFPSKIYLQREDVQVSVDSVISRCYTYEDVSRSFRTVRLERELQMVQLSATRCSYIAILRVSLLNFSAIILCVASSQRLFIVVVYFVIDLVRKLLDTHSYFFLTVQNL